MSARSTLDLSGWPAFDAGVLPKSQREVFLIRRTAIELYACGETVSAIEVRTGLHRRQLYRLLDRCQAPHDDGRPFGWRAVVPYAHVSNYERTAGTSRSAVPTKSNGRRGGAAGAFTQLLRAYPTLARWIEHSVQAKRFTILQTGTGDGLGLGCITSPSFCPPPRQSRFCADDRMGSGWARRADHWRLAGRAECWRCLRAA